MTEQKTPATPANAATPGNEEQGKGNTSVNTQAPQDQGTQGEPSEATVTISAKQFAQLNRDQARLQSFQKRAAIGNKNQQGPSNKTNNEYPDDEEYNALTSENSSLKEQLRSQTIGNGVRDLLSKPEYANLPESTKKLILKNPGALSDAQDPDEALLDIEDFINEEATLAAANAGSNQQAQGANEQEDAKNNQSNNQEPQGHQTPPAVGSGTPAYTPGEGLEDLSGLSGPARSRAALRNALKKKAGVTE